MKKYLYISILFLACWSHLQAKNYVICVGIADYPGTENDLTHCTTDAVIMKELYEKNGNAEVFLYTNEQATVQNITKAVIEMCKKALTTDAVVFFFSGHGLPGCFVCYDDFLQYDKLIDVMSKSMASCKIVFADACFSGKARKKETDERKNKENNVLFFLSSRSGEPSIERKRGWRNGLFTAYLERGLRGGADVDKNRTITARELFLFVNKGVTEQSRKKQHPVMWGRFNDDMPMMIW